MIGFLTERDGDYPRKICFRLTGRDQMILIVCIAPHSMHSCTPAGASHIGFSYPWDWPDSSPFRPPSTLGTGRTRSFHTPGHPVDWRGSSPFSPRVLLWGQTGLESHFRPSAGILVTGLAGLESVRPPGSLEDWVLLNGWVLCRLVDSSPENWARYP